MLGDRVVDGALAIEGGIIAAIDLSPPSMPVDAPILAPGFCDVHVHGWGGYDAMGGADSLAGMSRALLRRGVASFLPTAVTAPLDRLRDFAESVREWAPRAPRDGAQPLGFNLEGPFLAEARRGAHDPGFLRIPADVSLTELEPLLDGLRVITVAPELAGAPELIAALDARGVQVSLGHSAATIEEARAGFEAGATSTTHLFNAMSGLDHRSPGLAAAALLQDDIYTELIADGNHVVPALWPLIIRLKPRDRLLLVSDAIALAGTGESSGRIGTLTVDVRGSRVTLAGSDTLAGSVIALDDAVRNMVAAGSQLPDAVAAASTNPLSLLGIDDRGRIEVGQRADLVELDPGLYVRRVMLGGEWLVG